MAPPNSGTDTQPDQAFPADPGSARVRAVTGLRHQPGHQPERHAIAGLTRPQQMQDRAADRPAAPGAPLQHGVGERVACQVPQVSDPPG